MTRSWRQRLARRLRRWALALDPPRRPDWVDETEAIVARLGEYDEGAKRWRPGVRRVGKIGSMDKERLGL